jgi:hypothetical protein
MIRALVVLLGVLVATAGAAAEMTHVNVSHHAGVGYLTGPVMNQLKLFDVVHPLPGN